MTSHSLDPYFCHFRSLPCSLVTSSSSVAGLEQLQLQLEGLAAVCVAIGVSVFVAWAFDCLLSDNPVPSATAFDDVDDGVDVAAASAPEVLDRRNGGF